MPDTVTNPMSEVCPWVWGPEQGLAIYQDDIGGYLLIRLGEATEPRMQYLLQYGLPWEFTDWHLEGRGNDPQVLMAKAQELINGGVADDQWPDEMTYDDTAGIQGKNDRKLASEFNLNRTELGLYKFYGIVAGRTPPRVDNAFDLLDDLADDRLFGTAVDEIGRSELKFVWEFLGLLPKNAKTQAIWRIAVINPPASRQKLLVQMYRVANPQVLKPSSIKQIDNEKLIASIVDSPDKFLLVANRLMKQVGYPQAMLIMLSDLQRVRMLRAYLRLYGQGYIDNQYF